MFYFSGRGRSKVVHFEGCKHIRRIAESNLGTFESLSEAKKEGFHLCKCCNPVAKFYRHHKRNSASYCSDNRLICYFNKDVVEIKSIHSQWKLVANDEGTIDLYHKNTRFKKKDVDSPVWGYHLQKAFYKDMTSFLKYIVDHDKYRFSYLDKPLKPKGGKKPPVKGTKRWRAEQERQKKRDRRAAIKNVYYIFEQLDAARVYG